MKNPEYLSSSKSKSPIRVGDKVVITDGSGCLVHVENGLEHIYICAPHNKDKNHNIGILISKDCVLPASLYSYGEDPPPNDCIIKSDSGLIIYTKSDYLIKA